MDTLGRPSRSLDIDDNPTLLRLVDELGRGSEPARLRRAGKDVAVLLSAEHGASGWRPPLTDAERQAFLATSGVWEGYVEVEEFLADNDESRRHSSRPPVRLE